MSLSRGHGVDAAAFSRFIILSAASKWLPLRPELEVLPRIRWLRGAQGCTVLVVDPFPLVKNYPVGGSTADKDVKIFRQGMVSLGYHSF